MTKLITIELPEENEAAFWEAVQPFGAKPWEASAPGNLDAHIDEALSREQDPVLSQSQPWSEARKRYVGKGL